MADTGTDDQPVISHHNNNVFKEKELNEKSNMQFLHIANIDRPVTFYSFNVIISVSYRVKSKRGVEFRRWANRILKDYIIKGYAVNHSRMNQMKFAAESDLFGSEKDDSFKGIIGAIYQTFGGVEVYPTLEEKAANLLCFLTRNHSFSDGNKRIDDYALAALTIMIAESKPEEKESLVKVVMNSLVDGMDKCA